MKYTSGDLIYLAKMGMFDIIVHGCNCFNSMGSGIAATIRKEFPEAYSVDLATKPGDRNKLGTYTSATVDGLMIVNAYTQYSFSRNDFGDLFEYESFIKILDTLAEKYPTSSFGLPKIGCGLAHGDEEAIMKILEDFSAKVESTGGMVTLVEYHQ